MQKVAWPRTMVQKLKGISISEKADRNDMPVMMPGSAMGRMTKSEMASRPKNLLPETAAAQSVPRTSATSVEMVATCTDNVSACQTSGRLKVTSNQRSVRPGGGQT